MDFAVLSGQRKALLLQKAVDWGRQLYLQNSRFRKVFKKEVPGKNYLSFSWYPFHHISLSPSFSDFYPQTYIKNQKACSTSKAAYPNSYFGN